MLKQVNFCNCPIVSIEFIFFRIFKRVLAADIDEFWLIVDRGSFIYVYIFDTEETGKFKARFLL